MSTSTISLPADAMQQIVNKAILETLGEDQRDLVIASALQYLTAPTPGQYGRQGNSPLQDAFEEAARRCLAQIADEVLAANPDFQAKVRELLQEAVVTAIADEGGGWDLKGELARAMAGVLNRASFRDRS